jgi:hypothetical protein
MKKIITLLLTIGILFTGATGTLATSKAGVSANTTKINHYLKKDLNISINVKNDNDYEMGVELQPQKKNNKGKWVNLEWYDYDFYKPEQKIATQHSIKADFKNKKGEYRYKVTASKFDKDGFEVTQGVFYTGIFKIN